MAQQESDREDLIAEATAFPDRAEFQGANAAAAKPFGPVFVGFRRDQSFAIYLDQDPVYQFTADGQLRRAYVDGRLFRTQGATLAQLNRQRTTAQTTLARYDLTADELRKFLLNMTAYCRDIESLLAADPVMLRMVQAGEMVNVSEHPTVVGEFFSRVRSALNSVFQQDNPLAAALPTRRN